jgi:hypothetical protein
MPLSRLCLHPSYPTYQFSFVLPSTSLPSTHLLQLPMASPRFSGWLPPEHRHEQAHLAEKCIVAQIKKKKINLNFHEKESSIILIKLHKKDLKMFDLME